MPTNCSDNIGVIVHGLVEEDQITRTQLVKIIDLLLEPWFGGGYEPPHFTKANDYVHLLHEVRWKGRNSR